MISDTQRRQAAEALLKAGDECKPIPQVSRTWPEMEIADSYAVQQMWADMRVARGARVIGHKIGLTSRAMQQAYPAGRLLHPVDIAAGDVIHADFGPLGSIGVSFS